MLEVPYELVEHVSWLISARRHELRTRWRKLRCFKQAPLVLAHPRTAWAPGLHEALVGPGEGDFVLVLVIVIVIVDGTLIPTDRIAADEPYYWQNHKKHGMNVQVITCPERHAPVVFAGDAGTRP